MCFITAKNGNDLPPYKCCCCCGLMCGVVLIFILELVWLWGSVALFDITGTVVSSILVIMFIVSFVLRNSVQVRLALLVGYLARAAIFLLTMIF
mmetsp:Transcript_4494/g.5567  ORF Transcript_4494/g.5567 Transcript_4494/m.5567 type:complete len:94 (-) Transcript_4494:326-607(-)